MALISEYLAADLSADASADALGRINISYTVLPKLALAEIQTFPGWFGVAENK